MTKSTLRHQIDAVFAAVRRTLDATPLSLGLTKERQVEYADHLKAAETTLRWLEKHEATIRAAVAKKTEVADL